MALPRYGPAARLYDVLSAERPVYRAGRLRGVAALHLQPGMRVLDVGCGTGLNLPLLVDAVGSKGSVIGIDRAPAMLDQARRRIEEHGWRGVEVILADATGLCEVLTDPVDAVLWTYSLSIIDDWMRSWEQAWALTRSGGRMAVVDLAMPRGWGNLAWPLARFACWTGGVHLERRVWEQVLEHTIDVEHHVLRAGHIHVAAGTHP